MHPEMSPPRCGNGPVYAVAERMEALREGGALQMTFRLMHFVLSCRAGSLFPAFKAFLQSPGPDEDARRSAAYVQQLEQIQDYLKADSKGPYLGGQEPSAADLALSPKLYHTTVALKHFKVTFGVDDNFGPCCTVPGILQSPCN